MINFINERTEFLLMHFNFRFGADLLLYDQNMPDMFHLIVAAYYINTVHTMFIC